MRIKEIMRRSCAVTAVAALVAYHVGPAFNAGAAELTTREGNANAAKESVPDSVLQRQGKQEKGKKDYIVKFKTKTAMKQSTKTYEESTEINQNGEDKLEENKFASLELSGSEAKQLETNRNVEFVEEDKEVSACTKSKHKKVEKRHKKNESDVEWNVRMIHAENKAKKQQGAKKVKIAVLDSGVDWGNDINLAYQTSLVPGEEEMTQMFMDGSGHGSSVASLIAASDNGEGITGINPNAEIYSYRVLGDGNKAPISRVVEAIYMAINHKVNIINMSFGISEYSEALEKAVQDATDAGILVIAAAGNTGSDGVQYPAAYDEVMAVGAVDKNGSVEQYSAKGEELDLVAPGELVRTTGFIGSEEVVSGTSLAAPQVAAAASLIMEKNPSASPAFVRGLLNETANLYGESKAYGSGLLDAEYALQQYDNYSKKYAENDADAKNMVEVKENKRKVETFEDTGCVEGSWTQDDHEKMVADGYFNVRYGARFPDTSRYGDYENRVFARMTLNPWWHGYFDTNYIKAVIYETRVGDNAGKLPVNEWFAADTNYYWQADEILSDLKAIKWETELERMKKENTGNSKAQKQKVTSGFRRAFIWGMAIHSATDIYAHSVWYNGNRITHTSDRADSQEISHWRYEDAYDVARKIMNKYTQSNSVVVSDLLPNNAPKEYKLYKLYSFVKEAEGQNAAANVKSYSYQNSTK